MQEQFAHLADKAGNPPVFDIADKFIDALASNNKLILQAPPGAGKSTILPLLLLNDPRLSAKKIIMLEPRRLAVKAVASRMAELLGEVPGETIGYSIRFEKCSSPKTRIEIVTESILTRMIQSDNALEDVGVIFFDEFHERNLHSDLALALSLEIQDSIRDDLKLVVMSATLDIPGLSALMPNAPIIHSEGRQHPVSLEYITPNPNDKLESTVSAALRKALKEEEGDILVFLPGVGEIRRVAELLALPPQILVTPLYGDLPLKEQQKAIRPDPEGKRKVILSTSIAETSITIEGVRTVIDSGLARIPRFDLSTGFTRLHTVKVSMDMADQRSGRAGRLMPGKCYRLWPAATNAHLNANRKPEILEADLAPLILEIALWGRTDPKGFHWVTKPPASSVESAFALLQKLDALDTNQKITPRGTEMAKLPAHPRIAHMLLEARDHNQLSLAIDLAALLEERDLLGNSNSADLNLRLEYLHRSRQSPSSNANPIISRIERTVIFWRNYFKKKGISEKFAPTDTGLLLSFAYPERIAKKKPGEKNYKLATGQSAALPDFDPLEHESWIVAANLQMNKGLGRIYLAAPFDPDDRKSDFKTEEIVEWDDQQERIVAVKETSLLQLPVHSRSITQAPAERVLEVLTNLLKKRGRNLLDFNEDFDQFLNRIASAACWRKDFEWPDHTIDDLLKDLSWMEASLPNVRNKEDLKKINLKRIYIDSLSWDTMRFLDQIAPEKIKVPTGSLITLKYNLAGDPPVLAVRLQEVFGLSETPTINEGRTPVMMHLLSPAYRPVQVTMDLKSFWKTTYPEIRNQLRMRYPRHSWPEDPYTADPIKGPKKRRN